MTRCEQTSNKMIPAAAEELVMERGVAKVEGGEIGSAPVFPSPTPGTLANFATTWRKVALAKQAKGTR